MPRFSFIAPAALVLLTLLPILWAVAAFTPRRIAAWRRWTSLVVRSGILIALVLGIAGIQLILPARNLTTIFLIDRSDSIAAAQRQRAEAYVQEALQTIRSGDRAAVVIFGQNALVERAPSQLAALGRLTSVPIATRTNIQDAIQLGLALFPEDTQKRLVLLSDGGENTGRAFEATRLARLRNVPLDVVPLPSGRGPDVLIAGLDAPTTAREGQEIALGIRVNSSFETNGRLQVFVDGTLVVEQDQQIAAGSSTISLRVAAGEAGFRRIEARLETEGDSTAQNNRAAALTEVQGPPRILLIASTAARAINLQQAITANGAVADIRTPGQVPADLAQLGVYSGVVIVDTPVRDMPRPLLETLPVYVRDLGRGLAMIGGDRSFGAGGYRRTTLEPILPVELDPMDTSEQPDVALAMVIDRSGSMSDTGGSGGRTKLDLAKESVYQASLGLSERDQLGLVVFDEDAEWVLPLQQLPPASDIESALSRFGTGGGTNIRPGVEQAAQALSTATAKIKHVILLTDGMAESNYADLVTQMREQGVTISTVAIGGDANPNLEDIAQQGGGRFYAVRQVADVPNIFLQETVIVAGRDIVEQKFTPQVVLQSPIIRGLGGLPALLGHNGAEVKPTARTILVSPDGKPILAQEQFGLGRTIAWTSDFDGRWSNAWVQWSEFPAFVGGFIDLLVPPRVDEGLVLRATTTGEQAVIELSAQDQQGQPRNNLVLQGRLIDPNNQAASLAFTQIAPGRYRATAPAAETGIYLTQVAAADEQNQPLGNVTAGLAVSYSPEYSDQRENPQLLDELARVTNGRVNPPAATIFEPADQPVGTVRELGLPLLLLALLLWPLDIAVRRVFIRPGELLPARAPRPQPVLATESETFTRLGAAKRRAARETTPVQSSDSRPAPPPNQPQAAQSQPQAARTPPNEQPLPTNLSDDQFARLLAAKRRAKNKSSE